jgi:uncharacterized protein YgbK (DUF1537 family)
VTGPVAQRAASAALEALIIADDLTGAADSAVAFAQAGLSTRVLFAGADGLQSGPGQAPRVLALDTDSRRLDPAAAAQAVTDALAGTDAVAGTGAAVAGAGAARLRMKKIDSTLRGNIGAETRAALGALGCTLAICAPAFPGAGRETRDGVQWASGTAVGEVEGCFAGLRTTHVPLSAVRAGSAAALLSQARTGGIDVVVVDAATDEDLDQIVALGSRHSDAVLWVGSGGLGAALARSVSTPPGHVPPGHAAQALPGITGPALVVVGSATPVAARQAEQIVSAGAVPVTVPTGDLLGGGAGRGPWPRQAAQALAGGRDVVVRIGGGDQIVTGHGRAIVDALATAFAPVVAQVPPAVLLATGGETAMAFARALGGCGLEVTAELEPGVVCSRLSGGAGLRVVTKAGAFGDAGTLLRALEILRNQTSRSA